MGQTASSQRTSSLQPHHHPQQQQHTTRSETHTTHLSSHHPPQAELSGSEVNHGGLPPGSGLTSTQTSSSAPHILPVPSSEETIDTMPYDRRNSSLADVGSQNTSRTFASSTSAASRQSTMSRLGSRILPNSVVNGLLNSGEETAAEGRAHRTGLFSRSSTRTENSHHTPRFPSFGNISSRGINRRRSARSPYHLPRGEAPLLPDSSPNPTFLDVPTPERRSRSSRLNWRQRTRFSHVRHSIASPISQIFGNPPPTTDPNQTPASPPRRQSRSGFAEEADHLLPPFANMDTQMGSNEPHELDSVEPAALNARSASAVSSRRPTSDSRSQTTRLRRREEQTPLSRVLHLAAATIAAQLSGNPAPAGPGIQSVGPEGLDGPLESLLQGLQGATSSGGDESGSDEANRNTTGSNAPPHVNFLRVFRFVNSDPTSGGSGDSSASQTTSNDRMEIDGQDSAEDDNERRLLTLVVVGVRSMPSNNGSAGESGAGARPNIESLLPLLSPGNLLRNEGATSSTSRRTDRRSRTSAHRHSAGSSSLSHGQQRSQTSSRRQSDAGSSGDLAGSLPTTFTESPAGPNPPPSTPAEQNLSRVTSRANTPSRRPSSASAFLPQLNEDPAAGTDETSSHDNSSAFNFARQRRRSDSEAARHRGLGSGAARRNGVVEPDNPSQSSTRSWLIYVIGTNLAENHPAFATPSLFTDNPTYEDMVLLSSLLGPAKPPVASQDDLAVAGGLYRLSENSGLLVAESVGDGEPISVVAQERCLICLSDYEAGEEVRKLNRCNHMYHRECIDEWLLTGRNSCPMCRGEGISESENPSEQGVSSS